MFVSHKSDSLFIKLKEFSHFSSPKNKESGGSKCIEHDDTEVIQMETLTTFSTSVIDKTRFRN